LCVQSICLSGVAGPLTDAFDIDTSVRVFALLSLLPAVALVLFVDSDQRQQALCTTDTDQSAYRRE
jgi:hypothetical protein